MLPFASKILAAVTGREASGVEGILRGYLHRDVSKGRPIRVGRGTEFVGRRNIRTGSNVTFWGHAYLNATGANGYIEIGDDTHLDQFCVLYGQGGLRIGKGCAIAAGVTIYSQTNQYRASATQRIIEQPVVYAPVHVGDDVWIGARAVILPGVTIGDHAVVAAGAVVRSDVAPWHIVGGVPARAIGDRREQADRINQQK